ncbi:MAG: hypothetical protein NTY85_05055 [Actinobacteria bacterium]|nr:hypothetical protein [Actinomycetota bacterium]
MTDDSYHDDPIEEKPKRRLRNRFLTSFVVIVASVFFFQSTLASNISLNSGSGLEFGQGVSQTVACSGNNSLNVIPSAGFVNGTSTGTHYLGSVTVTNIPASCSTFDLFISAYDDSGTSGQPLFSTITSLPVFDNSGTFYTSSGYSSYVSIASSSAACVGVSGTCYGFTVTFKNPSLLATDVSKIVIQSGANIITLNCFQIAKECTWTPATAVGKKNWQSIASSSDGTKLVAVVYGGDVYTSTDSGATWVNRSLGNKNWWAVTSSSDGTKLVGVVNPGQIYTSTNSGVSWTLQSGSVSGAWRTINSNSDGTKLAAAVFSGYIYTSTDSGVTWVEKTNSGARAWTGICVSDDGLKLAATATSGGQIYTSTDSGASWTARESGKQWNALTCSLDGTKLVAAVSSAGIYISNNSGVTWTLGLNATQSWNVIDSSSDGSQLIAGTGGGKVFISSNSGVSWTTQTTLGNLSVDAAAVSGDGNLFVIGDSNSLAGYLYTGK